MTDDTLITGTGGNGDKSFRRHRRDSVNPTWPAADAFVAPVADASVLRTQVWPWTAIVVFWVAALSAIAAYDFGGAVAADPPAQVGIEGAVQHTSADVESVSPLPEVSGCR